MSIVEQKYLFPGVLFKNSGGAALTGCRRRRWWRHGGADRNDIVRVWNRNKCQHLSPADPRIKGLESSCTS